MVYNIGYIRYIYKYITIIIEFFRLETRNDQKFYKPYPIKFNTVIKNNIDNQFIGDKSNILEIIRYITYNCIYTLNTLNKLYTQIYRF